MAQRPIVTATPAPLHEVTFCVVDLETTGGSPLDDRVCEIGAVKVRGGEVLGTFETLVDPQRGIPPFVTMLTGLTDVHVAAAPTMSELVPTVAAFLGDAVLVAHNARFDRGFLDAEFERAGWPRLTNATVDTMLLARRLAADDAPDHRLGTLADRLRLDHKPTHRAMTDALAACDLLHVLIGRATGLGVLALDDLLALPRQAGHPMAAKLRLTEHLPRTPGVYAFVGAAGEVLYVGKATNLRQRTRSYFADSRRSIAGLLRQTVRIDHRTCTSTLEAAVHEARLIRSLRPRFNIAGRPAPSAVVRLDRGAFPRLVAGRRAPARGGEPCLGPMPAGTARLVIEAIESAVPLRRCAARLDRAQLPCREGPCTPAQIGVASCPCAGTIDAAAYEPLSRHAARALAGDIGGVVEPLGRRMDALAAARRYEEAALVRDRVAALTRTVRHHHRLAGLHAAGRVELDLGGAARAVLDGGVLIEATGERAEPAGSLAVAAAPASADDLAAERAVVAAWLDARGHEVRLVSSAAPWSVRWFPAAISDRRDRSASPAGRSEAA